jgi:hypothetical protein
MKSFLIFPIGGSKFTAALWLEKTLRAEEDRWDREGGTTWLQWEIRRGL